MVVVAAGNLIYASRAAQDGYRIGSWIDGLRVSDFVLVSLSSGHQAAPPTCRVPTSRSLLVATLGSVAGVAVLTVAPGWEFSSIGVAVAPDHGCTRADLLFAADTAMYGAKASGEPQYSVSPVVGRERHRIELAEDLYAALDSDQLVVEYQPVRAADGGLVGAEALVRWSHPTRERLAPDEFLPVAECHRLTQGVAVRVLEVTLGDLSRWRRAGHLVRASVNVSASDLDDRLVDIVAAALATHQAPAGLLTIEITESAMMRDPERARSVMLRLAERGVALAVADDGTGYSSLEYLLRLPMDESKLDRTFCAGLVADPRVAAIVRSTVDLTHALGRPMLAAAFEDLLLAEAPEAGPGRPFALPVGISARLSA